MSLSASGLCLSDTSFVFDIVLFSLSRRPANRHIVFDLNKIEYDYTYSKFEYERSAEFDMDRAMVRFYLILPTTLARSLVYSYLKGGIAVS